MQGRIPAESASIHAVPSRQIVGMGIAAVDKTQKRLIWADPFWIETGVSGGPGADAIRRRIDPAVKVAGCAIVSRLTVVDIGDVAGSKRIERDNVFDYIGPGVPSAFVVEE